MTLFREPVALEACPAKTAESVSYGATFTVLGWLLISNYSSIGHTEQESQSIANSTAASWETSAPNPDASQPIAVVTRSQPSNNSAEGPKLIEVSPPAWHASLEQYQYADSNAQFRVFSTAEWRNQEATENQPLEALIGDLALPLPLTDSDYLFGPASALDSNVLAETEPMGEITVRGSEIERLTSRADNIQRPQLPRPYRTQQIQRSLLLPPRIQALKP